MFRKKEFASLRMVHTSKEGMTRSRKTGRKLLQDPK